MSDLPDFTLFPYQAIFVYLYQQAHQAGKQIYLVGGAVRDLLLKRKVHDLDFVITGDARKIGKRLADHLGGGFFMLDDERNTARVLFASEEGDPCALDLAELRADSLESDLLARDFTVNAIAIDLSNPQVLIDPMKGALDLKDRVIRPCSPQSFQSDPVRVLRAVRIALSLDARFLPETLQHLRQALPLLNRSAMERHRDELFRMLGSKPASSIRLLGTLGVLDILLPELGSMKGVRQPKPHILDVWEHTLRTLTMLEDLFSVFIDGEKTENAENLWWGTVVVKLNPHRKDLRELFRSTLVNDRTKRGLLFFAALFHDIGKPATFSEEDGKIHFIHHEEIGVELLDQAARKFALSQTEIHYMSSIVQGHMRIHSLTSTGQMPSRRAIYRYFRDTGEAGVAICLLSLADVRATYGSDIPLELWEAESEVCRILLEAWFDHRKEQIQPVQWINGKDLLNHFHLAEGPLIGEVLAAVREAQAVGEITDRDGALRYAATWLEDRSFAEKENKNATS